MKLILTLLSCLFIYFHLSAQENQIKEIIDIIKAPAQPKMTLNSKRSHILFEHFNSSSIEINKLSSRKIQLAGVRFGDKNNFDTGFLMSNSLSVKKVDSDTIYNMVEGLPKNPQIFDAKWSPDGGKIAFCNAEDSSISLWWFDLDSLHATKVLEISLNFSMEYDLYKWNGDSKSLICLTKVEGTVVPNRGMEIPVVLEHDGQGKPSRTYQGLLKDQYDEDLFDYLATSNLIYVNIINGEKRQIGKAGIVLDFDPSPDGNYVLNTFIDKPYSYQYTAYNFPTRTLIIDINGKISKELNKSGLKIKGGLGKDAVVDGAREFSWRKDLPSTITWIEAQDGGNPDSISSSRDILFEFSSPFNGTKTPLVSISQRFNNIYWGNDSIAIIETKWWKNRNIEWLLFSPSKGKIIDTLSRFASDAFLGGPGRPVKVNSGLYSKLVVERGQFFYYTAFEYDSINGVMPVLKEFNLITKGNREIWRSIPPEYQNFLAFSNPNDIKKSSIIISTQTKTLPKNFAIIDNDVIIPVTFNNDFLEGLKKIERNELKYFRKDSVQLYGTLYTPKKAKEMQKKLPLLIWAYPVDFKDRVSANEILSSPYLFTGNYSLQQLLSLEEFAVLDYTSFPIVGRNNHEPNDGFIDEICLNAEAAVRAAYETGLIDSSKVAIAGHSYGAFLVANLLTHTSYFKTGIAQSGAYNRSLTPFGFQSEYRTYWDKKELYHQISPFQNADKLKFPILLIHGNNDDNPGTFKMQSDRYFEALKGLGKSVRYVSLPYEKHIYQSEESKIFVLQEMWRWLRQNLNISKELIDVSPM